MITSSHNPKVSLVSQLLTSKKKRLDAQRFVVDTKHVLRHMLRHSHSAIDYVLYSNPDPDLHKLITEHDISNFQVVPSVLNHIRDVNHSIGYVAVASCPKPLSFPDTPCSLALAVLNINNPSNLGTILRNATAFGCDRVYLVGHCCDIGHPECVRGSAGHMLSVPVYELSFSQLPDIMSLFYSIKVDAHDTPSSIFPAADHTLLVLGSEQGFPDHMPSCDTHYTIPMHLDCNSLNIGVASGIVLHEAKKGILPNT